jgi:dihydrolipoamide dehydrogenase
VGGGYIGLELGSVYAALGSQVTIAEMTGALLPGTDPELVRRFSRQAEDIYESIYLNTKITGLEEAEDHVMVSLEGEVEESEQQFERVLVAIGRRPNSQNLGLEEVGVTVNSDGFVEVDEEQRTTADHIFAVGDVAGQPLLAHKAMYEGKVAAEVIAGEPAAFDVRCVPAIVYTDPEIAWCGLTEAEAEEQGRPVKVGRFPWQASGRALTRGASEGLTKLLFDAETERVLGVGIIGRGAENMIVEGALAIEMGAVAEDLALTIHPHPTLAETTGEAAEAFLGMSTHIFTKAQS